MLCTASLAATAPHGSSFVLSGASLRKLRSVPDQSIRCPSLCGPAGHSLAWHLLKIIEWIKVGSKMPLTASRSPSQAPFFWQAVCGTRRRPAKDSVPNGHHQLRHETRKAFEQPSARNQPIIPNPLNQSLGSFF